MEVHVSRKSDTGIFFRSWILQSAIKIQLLPCFTVIFVKLSKIK